MVDKEFHLERPLRWGMIGGGRGSEIGYIHKNSALRDSLFTLVAAAFDVNPERGREFGKNLGLDESRLYDDYKEMFEKEAQREDGVEVVSIATPNFLHYEMAAAALNAGLHVICEKPLCFTVEEAEKLRKLALEKQRVFGVTYGYTGYPMVHQARKMIENGELGEIRIINTQFAHGFSSGMAELTSENTKWRQDPKIAGPTYVIGDIGTHALFLAETMVPGLEIEKLLCSPDTFVKSRAPMEDNAFVLMKFKGGASGTLWASAVNAGSMHQQKIRVVGSKASIEWWDEYPNQLRYEIQGKPAQVLERGMDYLHLEDEMVNSFRIGGGHAEGLFDAWANLYRRFGIAMDRVNHGEKVEAVMEELWFPNVNHGVDGVRFVENCVRSMSQGSSWVNYQ